MSTNPRYRLTGFIQYVPYDVGFVTPLFKDEEGLLYVQVSADKKTIESFERIPSYYDEIIQSKEVAQTINKDTGESCIYGFKNDNKVYYEDRKNIVSLLETEIKSRKGDEKLLKYINDFIFDFYKKDVQVTKINEAEEQIEKEISPEEVWKDAMIALAADRFARNIDWTKVIKVQKFINDTLEISTHSVMVKKLFDAKYNAIICDILKRKYGNKFQLKVVISMSLGNLSLFRKSDFLDRSSKNLAVNIFGQRKEHGFGGSTVFTRYINPLFQFKNFIIGDYNNSAVYESNNFCHKIENYSHKAFVIVGNRGMGKTHLLSAVANNLSERLSVSKILYTTGQEFALFLDSNLSQIQPEGALKFFKNYNVICIDDAQQLKYEDLNGEIYFAFLSYLSRNGIMITLGYNEEENESKEIDYYTTFFNHSLEASSRKPVKIAKIKRPGVKDRVQILTHSKTVSNFRIGKEALTEIVHSSPANLLDLKKGLVSVLLESSFRTNLVNSVFAKKVVQTFFERQNKLSMFGFSDLQRIIGDHYKIQAPEIYPSVEIVDKKYEVARQVFFFFSELMIDSHHTKNVSIINKRIINIRQDYSFLAFQERMLEDKDLQKSVLEIYHNIVEGK